MLRRLFKWTFRGLLIVVLLVVVIVVGAFFWLRQSVPELTARYELAGLEKPVSIVRDKNGVPHIYAQSEQDAYFAIGFVHAQDRLFQMVMQRRIAQGRVAELVGSMGLRADRFMRTLGLYRRAKASLSALTPETRSALESYARGVNAYLAARKELLPPEFNLLFHKPEPWTPADSVVWGKLMSLQLATNWGNELRRLALIQRIGAEKVRELEPKDPASAPATHAAVKGLGLDRLIAAIPWSMVGTGASNEWAVAGGRTSDGKPIVANDPHLGMTAPTIWYLIRVETPAWKLAGATVPGVPALLIGHNEHIAWGVTTPYVDTSDVFIEKIDPANARRYMTPEGPRPFVERTETIKVRFGDPVTITIRETRNGPVLTGLPFGGLPRTGAGHVLALRAAWLTDRDTTADAIFSLNRAKDWAGFRKALRRYIGPSQNFIFGAVDGTIAHITAGRIPIRKAGDGRLPVPGWDGKHDWIGYIPFDFLPQGSDPAKGFLVNANNRIVGPAYPFFLTTGWGDHYRATRITERLTATPKSTVATTEALQADILSLPARAVLPLLLTTEPADGRERTAIALLKAWDHRMDRHKPEPLIFAAWMYELGRALFADELGERLARRYASDVDVILNVLKNHPDWCDDSLTAARETCADRISASLTAAVARLAETYGGSPAEWRWGRAHQLNARHAVFGFIPLVRDFTSLRIETGGSGRTVNKATPSGREPKPFAQASGPGVRAIMPLGNLAKSRFILAGGPSGNPYSRFYDNLLEAWRDVRYIGLAADRASAEKEAAGILTLVPRTAPAK